MQRRFAVLAFPALTAIFVSIPISGCSGAPQGFHSAAYYPDTGSVSIHRMGGDIEVRDAPQGATLGTMGGSIKVGNVGTFAKLSSMGGDISVEHASGSVDASTMGGKITIRQVDGPVHANTMGGDITVHVTGSSGTQRNVTLRSYGGAVLLTVPKDFGMEVKIKLGYTRGHENVRIIQHLGLTERQSTEWEMHDGREHKYLFANGRVGDGVNQVTIETTNGDVTLKQE